MHEGLNMKSAKRRFAFVIMGLASIFVAQTVAAGGDECCTDPGHVSDCWWKDGERDSVVCSAGGTLLDGSGGTCDQGCDMDPTRQGSVGRGLCMCDPGDDAQCGSNVCTEIDAVSGGGKKVCGPSYCNGFLICSCWGGCEEAEYGRDPADDHEFAHPLEACVSHGIECSEGDYPANTSGKYLGYCVGDTGGGPNECSGQPIGTPCNLTDPNDCVEWACNGSGSCYPNSLDESVLATPAYAHCCDHSVLSSYFDDEFCTEDICTGTYHDFHPSKPANTLCYGSELGDECQRKHCVAGVCEWDITNFGQQCDPGFSMGCGGMWKCEDTVGLGIREDWGCRPQPAGPTAGFEDCSVTGGPIAIGTSTAAFVNASDCECAVDDYEADTSGKFALGCNDPTGVLNGGANSDHVWDWSVTVDNSYVLDHVAVVLDREIQPASVFNPWDPYMHARQDERDDGAPVETCEENRAQISCNHSCDFAGTNYVDYSTPVAGCSGGLVQDEGGPEDQYNSAMTMGPWPLYDVTNSAAADGIVSAGAWTGSVFVDHWETTDGTNITGGAYTLTLRKEAHMNDDCRNRASYAAAPIIDNFDHWKERFRGTLTNSYKNFMCTLDGGVCNTGGNLLGNVCGNHNNGQFTTSEPRSAFFRVDLSGGAESVPDNPASNSFHPEYWAERYKIYSDSAGTSGSGGAIDTAIARYQLSSLDGDCTSAVRPMHSACAPDYTSSNATGLQTWIEVSNANNGQTGDYELTALRVPRPFFGFQEPFGFDTGGACTKPTTWAWRMNANTRVDFIPTNNAKDGVMVKVDGSPTTDDGWLIDADPDDLPRAGTGYPTAQYEICHGTGCQSATGSLTQEFPFTFPYSGELYTHYCVNPAGQVLFGDSNLNCQFNTLANSEETQNAWVAPLWGSIIPCWCSPRESGMWSDPDAWNGNCGTGHSYSAASWDGSAFNELGGNGILTTHELDFEGTRAIAITWDGFDGSRDTGTHESGQSTGTFVKTASGPDVCNSWSRHWSGEYGAWINECSSCTENSSSAYNGRRWGDGPCNGTDGWGDCDSWEGGWGVDGSSSACRKDTFVVSGGERYYYYCCDDPAVTVSNNWGVCRRSVSGSTPRTDSDGGYRAAGRSQALQFQVILREDGRFVFYYKTSEPIMTGTLEDENSWIAGISGTRYTGNCSNAGNCNIWLDGDDMNSNGTRDEYYCDNTNHGVTEFRPGYRCSKDIGQVCSGGGCTDWHLDEGQPGSWEY
jgi:hypothetical protein